MKVKVKGEEMSSTNLHKSTQRSVEISEDLWRKKKGAKSWPMVRLGDVCEKVARLKDIEDSVISYIDISSVDRATKKVVETKEYDRKSAPGRAQQVVEKNDVLVSTVRPNLNAVAIVENSSSNQLIASTGFCVLRANEQIQSRYIYYFVQDGQFIGKLVAVSEKASYPSVTDTIVKDVYIPLPPLSVQREIVERLEKQLGEVDKVAANFRKIAEMADAEFKAELDETFGELERREFLTQRRKGAESAESACPNVRLGDVFDVVSARRVHKSDWKCSGIPFYRAREIVKLSDFGYVENQLFISEDLYERYKSINGVPWPNDLMVSGVGTVGRVYVVRENDKFYYKDASVLCFRNKSKVNPWFAKYYLESPRFRVIIHEESKGATVDTITMERAKEYPFLFPTLEVQKEIVAKLDAAKERCEKLKAEAERGLKAAENLRKAILSEAFE